MDLELLLWRYIPMIITFTAMIIAFVEIIWSLKLLLKNLLFLNVLLSILITLMNTLSLYTFYLWCSLHYYLYYGSMDKSQTKFEDLSFTEDYPIYLPHILIGISTILIIIQIIKNRK